MTHSRPTPMTVQLPFRALDWIAVWVDLRSGVEDDVEGDIRFVALQKDGGPMLLLLLLLLEEVVSEMEVRPDTPGPLAVGHRRPPGPQSTPVHGPLAICDDTGPAFPIPPEIDMADEYRDRK